MNNTLQVQFSPKLLNIVTVYFLLHVVFIKRVINVEAAKESEATFEDSKWAGGNYFLRAKRAHCPNMRVYRMH